MKKTININIGNSITHIEEDAYELLTAYLNEVKLHFAKNADDFEIVTDIENRIAEMFIEILDKQQRQVVSIVDVEEVIRQMGSVSDFEPSEEETAASHSGFQTHAVKKLYRDTDSAMVAGVCSGLAHYLNVDITWVRLAAFLTIFIGGSGILAYIILWIMIPGAETKTEKMTMKGLETNLRGFAHVHLEPFVQQSKGFIAEFVELVGRFISGTGRMIFKAVALFIIIFSGISLIGLLITAAAFMGLWDAEITNSFPMNVVNQEYFGPLIVCSFVVLGIPLLALILFSVRVAFSNRQVNRTLSFVLLIVWLAGIAPLIFYVTKVMTEFKEGAEFSQVNVLLPHKHYVFAVDRTRFFSSEDSIKYRLNREDYRGKRILADMDHEMKAPRSLRLWVEKSEDGQASLIQNFSARGRSFEDALRNAQKIHYDFRQLDSVLSFGPAVNLDAGARWRDQEVELTVKVPVGTRLNISTEFSRYLNGYSFWNCAHDNSTFTEWIMTDEGIKCIHELEKAEEEQ